MKRIRMCRTHYLGPTNTRGGRVCATHLTTGRRVVVPWDHARSEVENHFEVATELLGVEPEVYTSCKDGGYIFGTRHTDPRYPRAR